MKRNFIWALLLVVAAGFLASCSKYETYGDKKEKERNAINKFINDSLINPISETVFAAQDSTTDVSKNQYVYLNNTGVYMQIVRKGCGEALPDGKTTNVLCRFVEYNILDEAMQLRNDLTPSYYDKMTVTRNGKTYSANFASGLMTSTYGSSVPSGWLVPLSYINVGIPSNAGDEVAMVRLIVPHTQGQSYASSNVYPCFYVITYQKAEN